jgi:DNA invertase Pin-like site-specific DNA recombinase
LKKSSWTKGFLDKASGKDVKRPQLIAMLDVVREGDSVFCHSMDRLGRNLGDLRKLVDLMTERGISVHFLKEGLTFTKREWFYQPCLHSC